MHFNRRALLTMATASLAYPWPARAIPNSPSRAKSIAAWRRRIESILGKRRVPIIDLQATYSAKQTNLSKVMAYMDELDVAQTAFAVAGEQDGALSVELHRKYPEYFIPTTSSGEFPRWWNSPDAFLDVSRAELQTGDFFAMGEHEFRHYPSPEQAAAGRLDRDITVPIDSPIGDKLFAMSAEFQVPFQIHYEIEDALLPALEAMLERHPKALTIWCHLGLVRYPNRNTRYSPAYVRSLIERFPGLHFDLAVSGPKSVYTPSGARDATIFEPNGKIVDAWLALLEQHPDRFMVATDYRPPVENSMPSYIANLQRKFILDTLSERTRHLVAYGNAWRLITGSAWS